MKTINISVTAEQYKAIEDLTKEMGYASRSEFFRALLRFVLRRPEALAGNEFKLEEFKPVSLDKLKLELTQTGKYSEKFINSVIDGLKNSSAYENKTS